MYKLTDTFTLILFIFAVFFIDYIIFVVLCSVSGTPVKSPVSKLEIICNRRLITRLFEMRF